MEPPPYLIQILLSAPIVKQLDFYTIAIEELESVTMRYKFRSMMRASPIITQASVMPTAPSSNPPMDGSKRKKRTNRNEAHVLSTAPEDPPTHWQHTLICFYDPIDVEQDQLIEGSATPTQCKENH
ncbi:protein arginine N-methyltransferase [Salix suchowensis]|nr:protein arginine N-methyltransferase [Salix suchowensis]